jgi:hypothetical protein
MRNNNQRPRAFIAIGIMFMVIGVGQMNSNTAFSAFVPVGIVFLVVGLRKRRQQ